MGILDFYTDFKSWREEKRTRTEDEKIRTPEGYLIWTNIPLARTGTQLYAKGELPLQDKNGLIQVERAAEEVFSKDAMASFIGKPIVDEHPETGDVNHKNWRQYTRGIVLNVYKRSNDEKYLYGDVLVTDKDLQDTIHAGKCELSVGYDAKYKQVTPGYATQHDIYVNHLAVVGKGRAGSFCRIGDSYKFVEDQEEFVINYVAMSNEQREKEMQMLKATTQDADTKKRLAALNKLNVGSADKGESMDNTLVEKLLQTLDSMDKKLDALIPAKSKDSDLEESTDTKDESGGEGATQNKFDKGGSPGAKPANTQGTQIAPQSGEQDKDQRDLHTTGTKDMDIKTNDDYSRVAMFLRNMPEKEEDLTLNHKREAVTIAMSEARINGALVGIIDNVKTADAIALNSALAVASVLKREEINAKNGVSYPHVNTKDMDMIQFLNKKNQDFWKRGA